MVHKILLLLVLTSFVEAAASTPIIVTAKRQAFVNVPPSMKTIRFSGEQLKRNQYSQVVDVLNVTPGYAVVQAGGPGQQSSIFVRGTNSNHLHLRQDGMRINSPEAVNGTADIGLLTTQNLSLIEVCRGGYSSLYGSDAVGGVVLLQTPKGTGTFIEGLRLEVGSHKTASGSGHLAGAFNNTGLYLGVSGLTSQGIHQTPPEYRQAGGYYPRLPFHQASYALRLDHICNDQIEFSLISRLTAGRMRYQYMERPLSQHRQQGLQRALVTIKATDTWQHQVGIGYFTTQQHNDRHEPTATRFYGQRQQADWRQTFDFNKHDSVMLTTELSKDSAKHIDFKGAASFRQLSQAIGALWQRKGERIALDLSVRHDKTSGFQHSTTHRQGLTLTPFKKTKVLASHATSFKTPTLYQLYAQTPYFNGNPHLKPETAHQWEAGFEHTLSDQLLWEETYFINHLKGLIESTPDWTSVANVGRARTSGLESCLRWLGKKGWSGDINHTYTKAYNLVTGQRLLRRPIAKVSGRLHYAHEQWLWTVEVSYIGRRLDIDPITGQRLTAKPYPLVNFKVQKASSNSCSVFGRIENLCNRRIQEPVGYRKAGLSVFMGMEKKIG
ncbi:TonB-dependent receptor plug domain-containing protein [Candidatus Odyssella thessalonicensis]|uniref:TonB-dependent receptor plug domain-containing protein n=1 Tax=Candidatus Odyssella thessalonicensis TaxID=84647 RepID=UPI0002EDA8DB|nr:TonB-dependent receptor [Candidatus Odyssella thessalonicensis]